MPEQEATMPVLEDANKRTQLTQTDESGVFGDAPSVTPPEATAGAPPPELTANEKGSELTASVTFVAAAGLWSLGQHVSLRSKPNLKWTSYPLLQAGTVLQLPPRQHEAVCVSDRMGAGQQVSFAPEDGGTITLTTPTLFALTFRIIDYPEGEPVPAVRVEMKCTVGHEDLAVTSTAFSDEFGYVATKPIRSGHTSISISKVGYESAGFDLELPGQWREQLAASNTIDLGVTDIVPITPFRARLKSTGGAKNYESYRVSHTHRGRQYESTSSGKVDMQLGVHSTPLYLKVWYPDDHVSIRYLDGGMPPVGEPHEIVTHTPVTIEIDLDCSDELESILAQDDFTVAASFNARNGDAVKNTRDVAGPGIYAIHGADASSVTISLEKIVDGTPTTWALESTTLPASGVASVPMHIGLGPAVLALRDGAGMPVPDASIELRAEPDRTGWTAGGKTNIDGEVEAPRSECHARLRASWKLGDRGMCYAVGIPIDMSLPGDTRIVRLGELMHPRIQVTCNSGPVQDYELTLGSTFTTAPFTTLRPNPAGIVEGFGLTSDSNATVSVEANGLWFPNASIPLTGSDVKIDGFKTGMIVVAEHFPLGQITSRQFGRSLEDWSKDANLGIQTMPNMSRRIQVPRGTYEVRDRVGEVVQTIEISEGEERHVGID